MACFSHRTNCRRRNTSCVGASGWFNIFSSVQTLQSLQPLHVHDVLEDEEDIMSTRTMSAERELAVVEFWDSKNILFVSDVYIFDKDMNHLLYRCVRKSGAPKLTRVPRKYI